MNEMRGKRFLLAVCSIMIIFAMIGCAPEKVDTKQPEQEESGVSEEEKKEELVFEPLEFDTELIYEDAFSMSIENGWSTSEKLRVSDNDSYVNHGSPFFVIEGTYKNLSQEANYPWLAITAIFDGKWKYDGMVSTYGCYEVVPLQQCKILLSFEVPQEVIDSFQTCDIRISYNEDNSMGTSFEDNAYRVHKSLKITR